MPRGLGHQEIEGIIEEQGKIEVRCEFCIHSYRFDAVDTEQLFTEGTPPDIRPTMH